MDINAISFSSNSRYLITGSKEGIINIYDMAKQEDPAKFFKQFRCKDANGNSIIITSVAINDSVEFAYGSEDGSLRFLSKHSDLDEFDKIPEILYKHEEAGKGPAAIRTVAISDDGRFVASGSKDRSVFIFDRNYEDPSLRYYCLKNVHEGNFLSNVINPSRMGKSRTYYSIELKISISRFL